MLEATLGTEHQIATARDQMLRQVRRSKNFPALIKITTASLGSPFQWLKAQRQNPRILWSNRGEDLVVAGTGTAARVIGAAGEDPQCVLDRCREVLGGQTEARLYGGFSFRCDLQPQSEAWQAFGVSSFWLPRTTYDGEHLSVFVLDNDDREAAIQAIEELSFSGTTTSLGLPDCLSRDDLPEQQAWNHNVEKSLSLFREEVLDKVVLARKATFEFSHELCPIEMTERLAAATHACYHFCLQPTTDVAFLGATPERLFSRRDREFASEVVAGTRRRDTDEETDRQLAAELLASTKDQLEHDIVRKSIRQRLHAYVESLGVDAKASILKLAKKQHLFSRVVGMLKDGVGDGQLIKRLHPTPAVGGYPTENALEEIERLEPFERGWYAGPVGWIGTDAAEFAVAIRSGLLEGRMLSLYSGAGIVPGSTPQLEWEEIEHKIGDFLEIIQSAD